MKNAPLPIIVAFAALATLAPSTRAAEILGIGDLVIGGRISGDEFLAGILGNPLNGWSPTQNPANLFDGLTSTVFHHTAEIDVALLIRPGVGSTVATSFSLTAGDNLFEAPLSYVLMGTNVTAATSLFDFQLISAGLLPAFALPETGITVPFLLNSLPYTSYLLYFPATTLPLLGDGMEMSEMRMFGTIPEPATGATLACGAALLSLARRRNPRG